MSNSECDEHFEKLGSTEPICNDTYDSSLSPSEARVPSQTYFARLVPISMSAKRAFHEVASILRDIPETSVHQQKFLCIEDPVQNHSEAYPPSFSSIDTNEAVSTASTLLLSGYYCLDLNILPRNIGHGWIIGSGHSRQPHLGADLRISANRKRDDVSGRHARLFHHPSSGVLMLVANPGKMVIINGQEVKNDNKRVLSVTSMGLTFGNLSYRFEFVLLDNPNYREQLGRLLQRNQAWSGYQESFDPTPSENHFELRDYQFQTPSFYGTYGVVSACVKLSTGVLYAVKRIQRVERVRRLIENELSVLRRLGSHPHICSLIDVFYSNGDAFSMGSRSVNDVYIILDPWAPSSFRALVPPTGDLSYQKSAFHQGAQGIRYLHSQGFIHRDIKLSNLLLASRAPLRVVIADFGHTTMEKGSRDHNKGTVAYLPPEILALKGRANMSPGGNGQYWTTASDVFMYGLVGLELFGEIEYGLRTDIRSLRLQSLITTLLRSADSWKQMFGQMVALEPNDRLDMRQILLKNIWLGPETPVDSRKRQNNDETRTG